MICIVPSGPVTNPKFREMTNASSNPPTISFYPRPDVVGTDSTDDQEEHPPYPCYPWNRCHPWFCFGFFLSLTIGAAELKPDAPPSRLQELTATP